MDKLQKLFEAAEQGSIISLQQLLEDDRLILVKAAINCLDDNPLHVAVMRGRVDFVKEVVLRQPKLVDEVNSHKSTALHMAAATGDVEVVKALLSASRGACLALDRDELTPLHLAAAKGRVEVVKLLLEEKPDAARSGQRILHLCVKQNQLEALEEVVKAIDNEGFINLRDDRGNTVLHLAVADKQIETVRFLLSKGVEVNAVNEDGMTALDVTRSKRDVRDSQIENSLKNRGGQTVTYNNNKRVGRHLLMQTRSSLMVMLVVVLVGVNPLASRVYVWNSDIANLVLFIFFVGTILLLMRQLPFPWRFFRWIAKVFMCIAGTIILLWHICMHILFTPGSNCGSIVYVIGFIVIVLFILLVAVIVWIIRTASRIVARTIRLIIVKLGNRKREH